MVSEKTGKGSFLSNFFFLTILFIPSSVFLFDISLPNLIFGSIIIGNFLRTGKVVIPRELKKISFIFFVLMNLVLYLKDLSVISYLNSMMLMITPFLFLVLYVKTESDLRYSLNIFEKSCFLYSILGIIESFTKFNIFNFIFNKFVEDSAIEQMMRFGIYRPRGMATMTINNCIILIICFIIVSYNITIKKERSMFDISVLVLIVTNAILTLSRSALLAMFVVIIYYICINKNFRPTKKNIKIVLAIFLLMFITYVFNMEKINSAIRQFYLMFAVVFNFDKMTDLSNTFGANAVGIGHRFQLFEWVLSSIKDNMLFGLGYKAQFIHQFTSTRIKTSIENYYASLLFHFGIAGIITYVILEIGIIKNIFIQFKNKVAFFEGRIKLNKYGLLFTILYLLVLLSVSAIDDLRIYSLLIGFVAVRNRLSFLR